MLTDTIAAISTGGVNSGINIIRISGKKSFKIISKIFTNYNKLDHQKIIYGKILDNTRVLDEALVSYFKEPNSFTGEDVIEINCHGGREITLEILDAVIKNGARIAEPGEFSKRGFLNGKIDLSKAEAIMDVINSKTKLQAKISINQLEGGLEKNIKKTRNELVELMAHIEVSIDYPEYDYAELETKQIIKTLKEAKEKLENMIKTYSDGKYIKEGINAAIIGGPNVGKSSLLNKLAKKERAIVTDIEGTTRDIIEETIIVGNIILNISDTAGIRDTEDIIEKIGINKSLKIIENVDLIIYIIDGTVNLKEKDIEVINKIKETNKPFIICINKTDISRENINEIKNKINIECLEMSVTEDQGIETLKTKIKHIFNIEKLEKEEDLIIVNERHKSLIAEALKNILEAIAIVKNSAQIDIISINIKQAIIKLGEITGEDASIDIVDKIFERFCLGK